MGYMYEKYDYSMFESRFYDYDRQSHFPRGLRALYDYLCELAADTGEPLEVDVIGLCCDFAEIDVEDVQRETGYETLEELCQNTTVIHIDDYTIIYQV